MRVGFKFFKGDHQMARYILVLLLTVFIGGTFLPLASGEEPYIDFSTSPKVSANSFNAFYDIIVMRPVGVIACAAGLVTSVIALPFSLPSQSHSLVYKNLIAEPFSYTFQRPIGEGVP